MQAGLRMQRCLRPVCRHLAAVRVHHSRNIGLNRCTRGRGDRCVWRDVGALGVAARRRAALLGTCRYRNFFTIFAAEHRGFTTAVIRCRCDLASAVLRRLARRPAYSSVIAPAMLLGPDIAAAFAHAGMLVGSIGAGIRIFARTGRRFRFGACRRRRGPVPIVLQILRKGRIDAVVRHPGPVLRSAGLDAVLKLERTNVEGGHGLPDLHSIAAPTTPGRNIGAPTKQGAGQPTGHLSKPWIAGHFAPASASARVLRPTTRGNLCRCARSQLPIVVARQAPSDTRPAGGKSGKPCRSPPPVPPAAVGPGLANQCLERVRAMRIRAEFTETANR